MDTRIHPFEKYPFDLKTLDKEIVREIEQLNFYTTVVKIEKIMEEKDLKDTNTLLCWAYFEWLDAMAMKTGGEILSCGEKALNIIDGILEKEPGHKGSVKLKKYIETEIKQVHKANKWFDKYHHIPIESLALKEVEDFACFLSDCANDAKFKEKEYQLWQRLYQEKPDTHKVIRDGIQIGKEYYGFKFYYLCRMADVLWQDLKKFELARPMLWEIINWPQIKDAELYTYNQSSAGEKLLLEAVEQQNKSEFIRLTELMILKFKAINTYRVSIGKSEVTMIMREQSSGAVLQFALDMGDPENIRSVVTHFFSPEQVVIKDKKNKENLLKARAMFFS
jgi:hypothetical protein